MKITYYEIKNDRYKEYNPLPLIVVQIGDYSAGARFLYDEVAWQRNDDLFYDLVWDADPDEYREITEAAARTLVESAGGKFAPYVWRGEDDSDGQSR